MKKVFTTLSLLYTITAFTQEFAISNWKQNIAFKEANNPMIVVVQGYPCKSIFLTTDNGKIQQSGCNCTYRPAEAGNAIVKVWVKKGTKSKMVGQVDYRVKSIFPPVAFIGASNEGSINLKVLKAQGGVRTLLLNSDFQAPFVVKSYTVTALRDTLLVFSHRNIVSQFDSSLLKKLDLLKTNDMLLVSNIICIGPDQKEYRPTPLEFTIKE